MSGDFHKPTRLPNEVFDYFEGAEDPAQVSRVAHDTAAALLARVRENPAQDVVDRLVAFTDVHGIDTVAELWARSGPHTLPGALWRIYLLRLAIRQNPTEAAFAFQRGVDELSGIDPVIAGAPNPAGPDEVTELADRILRGIFVGDFADALERAAAFCRITASGATSLADDYEHTEPQRATELTTRALRYSTTAGELATCAHLWRSDQLD
ncbi:MAG TPA: DNA-directed RNA polymerase subunit beta [Terrimesophilobacter sp.]|nr:DNA-directed RNA polymerase subunit beta [Terrimesophilobacter sp.]